MDLDEQLDVNAVHI